MKKGLIIYKSKYGTTKKYAEWLAQEIEYDIMDISKAKIQQVSQYDNIVICGAIYASGISALKFLKKYYEILNVKNIAIFCVGASPFEEKAFNEIKELNLKGELQNIPIFYGRGAWNEAKMNFIDRKLCAILQKVIINKDPSTYEHWETALVEAIDKACDWTDKKYLLPLIETINKWQ